VPASSPLPRFVRDERALDDVLYSAKLHACPHCRRTGALVGHGMLRGYDEHGPTQVVRGRRLLCSSRFRRPGCGRTVSVRIAHVIARFTVRTEPLTTMLRAVVEGSTRRAAWLRAEAPLTLRTGYRLWRRLLVAQPVMRTAMCRVCPPPASSDHRPIALLFVHMQTAFGTTGCVFAALQTRSQQSLFG